MSEQVYEIHDQSDPSRKLKVTVICQGGHLELRPEGYGEKTAEDGFGSPVVLDLWEGRLRVMVAPDINVEDPTIIDIEGAREDSRDRSWAFSKASKAFFGELIQQNPGVPQTLQMAHAAADKLSGRPLVYVELSQAIDKMGSDQQLLEELIKQ